MFGIGRLEKRVDEFALSLSRSSRSKDERLCELETAIALFARKCDQCGAWKRIDAKGWMKRGHSANSLMWFAMDGTLQTSSGERYICPECMATLEPVDEETKVNSDPSWKRWRR